MTNSIVANLPMLDSATYPEDPSARYGVDHEDTHISDLFFTANCVYKFRKNVDRGFLDFRSRRQRNEDCLREVVANRRLAPDVYFGVAPLIESGDGCRVGAASEDLTGGERHEHCVVMRRLAEGDDAESRLRSGRLSPEHLEELAERLCQFHQDQRIASERLPTREASIQRIAGPVSDNFEALNKHLDAGECRDRLQRLQELVAAEWVRAQPWFDKRRRLGLWVDGHGDLRLEHVWFEDRKPVVVIDCLEFDSSLREGDPAGDIGFLGMDLLRNGESEALRVFVQHSVWASDDYSMLGVLDHFIAHAACVRAKVERDDPGAEQRSPASRLIDLAMRVLSRGTHPLLIMMCGVVGTGKTTVALEIAKATNGVIVTSDRVRQRLAEILHLRGEEIYNADAKSAVYCELLARAEPVLDSGRHVILDATYSAEAERERVIRWAAGSDVRTLICEARASEKIVLERLDERKSSPDEPSDAGPEYYEASVRGFDRVRPDPNQLHLVVDTGAPRWRTTLRRTIRRLGIAPSG